MKIHLIACGGAVMHNLTLALHYNHHTVTGSDDEIYNPAHDRLQKAGLLPKEFGWHPERITADLDAVILGMHARKDNPELLKAQALGLPIYSFPEFVFQQSKDKTRVAICGSHGKTTTTAMIMHVLQESNIDFDYLVGAQLEGFERMVKFSDAPIIIIEGDEYLSSPIDRRPKFVHYQPDIAVITGIAWDHKNVFPTFENYVSQFELLTQVMNENGKIFFYSKDENIKKALSNSPTHLSLYPYTAIQNEQKNGTSYIKKHGIGRFVSMVFGQHNFENMQAAKLVCLELGVSELQFYQAISTFKGAAKRLQLLSKTQARIIYKDFAHAPSKAKATTTAIKSKFEDRTIYALLELHTFSSLSKDFLPEYQGALDAADHAVVFFSEHTLKMKKLPALSKAEVKAAFGRPDLLVINTKEEVEAYVQSIPKGKDLLLFMSSGTFGGYL